MNKLFFALFSLFHNHFALSATVYSRWQAGVSDPTLFGWLTVLVYFAAVARCITKSKESKFFGGNYRFWLYLAALLLLLGINKQLDLHSWFAEIMRDRAQAYGWYKYRHSVLVSLVSLLGFGIISSIISFRLYLANSWRNYKVTWAGIIVLLMLVLIQTSSSIYADALIKQRGFGFSTFGFSAFGFSTFGFSISAIIEISALILIIIGTYFNKNKFNPLTEAITLTIKDYVETSEEGKPVQCPQCGMQPLSKPKDGRVFKCRSCGFHYSVRVVDNH